MLNSQDTIGSKIRQLWKSQDIRLRQGVSRDQVRSFEHQFSVFLPDDLVDYFRAVDGMNPNEMDANGFLFLPLSSLNPLRESHPDYANFPDAGSYFVFADYLTGCWWYAVRLSSERTTENTVLGIGWDKPRLVACSFTEFAELYFADHAQLYEACA
jgi:hypothetical protein